MRKAGCVGINFGADSGDTRMLKLLKRDFSPDDIINTARFCRDSGIAVMFDLLLGAPGETRQSINSTIEVMKRAGPDRVGVSMGVRIYPGTELDAWVKNGKLSQGLYGGSNQSEPLFFLEPKVAPFITDLISRLTAGDKRFLFFNPDNPDQNYNYNANDLLVNEIKKGARGAYWDILRKIG
jgi:hypothetical protein